MPKKIDDLALRSATELYNEIQRGTGRSGPLGDLFTVMVEKGHRDLVEEGRHLEFWDFVEKFQAVREVAARRLRTRAGLRKAQARIEELEAELERRGEGLSDQLCLAHQEIKDLKRQALRRERESEMLKGALQDLKSTASAENDWIELGRSEGVLEGMSTAREEVDALQDRLGRRDAEIVHLRKVVERQRKRLKRLQEG